MYFNWRIITSQSCDGFCHTSTWICHRYTCVPPCWTPLSTPSSPCPSGLSQGTCFGYPASCIELVLVIYLIYGDGCLVTLVSNSFDPMDCSPPGSSVQGDSPGKNTGVGCHALLQGIFPTQGLNSDLLHCRWILYHLSHQGSPYIWYCTCFYAIFSNHPTLAFSHWVQKSVLYICFSFAALHIGLLLPSF